MPMDSPDAAWVNACRRFEALTVGEVDRLMAIGPLVVRPEESLLAVARRIVGHPECRVICVADAAGTLLGLLPLADLAFASFVHVMPEVFLRNARDLRHGSELARLSHARTAREAMRPPVALRPDDRLEVAFGRLLETSLEGLPIVDAAGRVIGYLNLPEFLSAWLANCPPVDEEDSR
jgi:CBS domain-containing protein